MSVTEGYVYGRSVDLYGELGCVIPIIYRHMRPRPIAVAGSTTIDCRLPTDWYLGPIFISSFTVRGDEVLEVRWLTRLYISDVRSTLTKGWDVPESQGTNDRRSILIQNSKFLFKSARDAISTIFNRLTPILFLKKRLFNYLVECLRFLRLVDNPVFV